MKPAVSVLFITLILTLTGCTAFYDALLPPHENSLADGEEKVELKLLTATKLQEEIKKIYPIKPELVPESTAIIAAAAGAAFDFAVKHVKKSLVKEAERYEDQFEAQVSGPDYWIVDAPPVGDPDFQIKYRGFLLTKSIDLGGKEKQEVFRLLVRFVTPISMSSQKDKNVHDVGIIDPVIVLQPIYYKVTHTAAKVLDTDWLRFWTYFMAGEGKLKSTCNIRLTGSGFNRNGGFELNQSLGEVTFELPEADLNKGGEWRAKNWQDASGYVGVLQNVPVPGNIVKKWKDGVYGFFKLTVRITEMDQSKTVKYIKKAQDELEENKDKWKEKFLEKFKLKSND